MEDSRPTEYWCTTGHPIAADALDSETDVVTLDGDARVRICREHGAPIASRERAAGLPS